jgi:hypothetical protein
MHGSSGRVLCSKPEVLGSKQGSAKKMNKEYGNTHL